MTKVGKKLTERRKSSNNKQRPQVSSKEETAGARKTRRTRKAQELSWSKWRQTWRQVAHTSRPQWTRSGPKSCARSVGWSSFWCNGKENSTSRRLAARRLERLERECSQLEDEEREASLEEALADHAKVVKLTVDKWCVDKGFGFGKAPTGEVVLIHASVVQGAEVLVVGTEAWTQVVSDQARAEGGYRARKAWGQRAWREEKDRERANRAAQQVRRTAALTAELAAQSESKVFEVCSRPPGLSDESPVTASPHLVNDSPPCSPSTLGMSETPASTLPVTTKPLQRARVSHLAGSFRAPRSNTRAQDNTVVLEETLRLFVEATGNDEASMRQQLVSKRPVELLRDREFWRTRVEEKQRFQAKKKEAWEFFRRVPSFKPKSQEAFKEQFAWEVPSQRDPTNAT